MVFDTRLSFGFLHRRACPGFPWTSTIPFVNVILFGYRASGKTTIGSRLADRLGRTFVDVDERICARFGGRTIAQIWADEGEPAFRRTESQEARALCRQDDLVIGLGGGTLMQDVAREAVRLADAHRVYLKCEPEELLRRIREDEKSTSARPNLTGLGGGIEEIQAVLGEREPIYRSAADQILDVTHLNLHDAVEVLAASCRADRA